MKSTNSNSSAHRRRHYPRRRGLYATTTSALLVCSGIATISQTTDFNNNEQKQQRRLPLFVTALDSNNSSDNVVTSKGIRRQEQQEERRAQRSSSSDDESSKKRSKGKKGSSSDKNGPGATSPGAQQVEIRFSKKIEFDMRSVEPSVIRPNTIQTTFPLTSDDYPLSEDLCTILQQSNCPSVVMPDDPAVIYGTEELIDIASHGEGCPPHAPNPDFWPEMREVIYMQLHRRLHSNDRAMGPKGLPYLNLPKLWSGYSIFEVAEAVHNEYPGLHQSYLIGQLLREGMQPDNDIIPQRCIVQFLHGPVLYARLNTWSIDHVGPMNFSAKYFCGRARPEEVAMSIHCSMALAEARPSKENIEMCQDVVTMDLNLVPKDIQRDIESMQLKSMEEFTSYPEGSPMHPSWPAMHSAASNMSLWLCVVSGNLTDEQMEEIKRMDLAVAMARTVAGVHYYKDNVAGLEMGQEITARSLKKYLKDTYDADSRATDRKIKQCRFDWYKEAERLLDGRVPI